MGRGWGARGGPVGWGTALQAGLIPDGDIGIFHWHNPSSRTMVLGLTQPLTEISTRNISWGQRRPVRRADNLTTFVCRLSWNVGASTSWNPQGLSRPVMVLFYLYLFTSWWWAINMPETCRGWWRNKRRVNSASSWFLLHRYAVGKLYWNKLFGKLRLCIVRWL